MSFVYNHLNAVLTPLELVLLYSNDMIGTFALAQICGASQYKNEVTDICAFCTYAYMRKVRRMFRNTAYCTNAFLVLDMRYNLHFETQANFRLNGKISTRRQHNPTQTPTNIKLNQKSKHKYI